MKSGCKHCLPPSRSNGSPPPSLAPRIKVLPSTACCDECKHNNEHDSTIGAHFMEDNVLSFAMTWWKSDTAKAQISILNKSKFTSRTGNSKHRGFAFKALPFRLAHWAMPKHLAQTFLFGSSSCLPYHPVGKSTLPKFSAVNSCSRRTWKRGKWDFFGWNLFHQHSGSTANIRCQKMYKGAKNWATVIKSGFFHCTAPFAYSEKVSPASAGGNYFNMFFSSAIASPISSASILVAECVEKSAT